MYSDPNITDQSILYQGDIIKDFPFFNLEKYSKIKKEEDVFIEDKTLNTDSDFLSIIEAKVTKVMILTQTCDIQRRDNIIICPIFSVSNYKKSINKEKLEALKDRKINYWFYLPNHGELEESFADLQLMQFVPREIIIGFLSKRISSLSDLGRHNLAWNLSLFFSRPINR